MSDALDEIFCCDSLKGVVADLPEPAAPTIYRADNGVLMMVVGLVQSEEGLGYLDQAIMHCPFCGTQLQDAKAIAEKVSH
ncbi:hypothetical protein GGI64_003531 [Rhizobium leguminosarum]|uniref:Uncharacterized protein n=6 Tax=Rhizobium TaxID=379 RepID=A0A2A6KJ18_9HYPH|nr:MULTISPECIES: hypothetical protein [Rhizobium]EJC76071.1 hypothetical protein Rleg10DRAFT_4715 [Rhizobium leguminosarum bv. trifolii WSM2012]ACI56914.1 conserved hypothetical protein [Rhizobium leguminosarum bv. trifolii WSM2304]EJB05203.1 hypothetical protein Rleg9DRAFT_4072 [Rhizobium leguminosarum bv. trifolii WSM597]EJC81587.1 hypothetical protein Rleg4DRAFT_3273 [Rhizobium leguminosarum bv. trifolii WSM2297]MBB3644867.1 hypothetical protein [Rhizobium sp. BK619]